MATIKWDDVTIKRVLISYHDAKQKQGNTFTIELPVPVEGAFNLELLNTTFLGKLLQLDEWGRSVTSAGRLYWWYMDTPSNQRFIDWQNQKMTYKEPRTLRTLVFSVWNTDSSPAEIPGNFAFELAVHCIQ